MKVYCKNCRHNPDTVYNPGIITRYCRGIYQAEYSFSDYREKKECRDIYPLKDNANGDCKFYEPFLSYRIKLYFKKLFGRGSNE